MRRISILAVLGMLTSTTPGCSSDECLALPCVGPPPAVTLRVVDAIDGGPVADLMANGLPCGSAGVCFPQKPDGGTIGAGTSSIDVTAPGHDHVQLDVTVPSATPDPCSCQPDYVPQTRDVYLTPL
jgi:hypothetical protein